MIPDFESPEWNARREELQKQLIETITKLLDHTGSCAFFWDHAGIKLSVELTQSEKLNS